MPEASFVSIVGFTTRNEHHILFDLVNKTVFIGNMTGPKTGQITLERFRLTRTRKRSSDNLFNETADFTKNLFVFDSPLLIVSKGRLLEQNVHI